MTAAIFKFIIYFVISYCIMAIPIQGRPIFLYLNDWTAPYTNKLFSNIISSTQKGLKTSAKLFSNSNPSTKIDALRSSYSSMKKNERKVSGPREDPEKDLPLETYTVEEEELIKKLVQ